MTDDFPDTVIIGSNALYPLAKGAIQMLIIIIACIAGSGDLIDQKGTSLETYDENVEKQTTSMTKRSSYY